MTKKIKTILVDDEPLCTAGLEIDLSKTCPEVEIIATCNSAKLAIAKIKNLQPDLVFLDIEMPWMNGFELLEVLSPIDFQVIFVTAYDEFAVKAFRAHAIDYIMKPINRKHLKEAVNKIAFIQNQTNDSHSNKIEQLIRTLNSTSQNRKLSVPNADGYDLIPINEILYCHAIGNYTEIYTTTEKKFVSRGLKQIENSLDGNNFHRVHASYLVNLDKVKSIHRNDGGYLIMENDYRINMSRNKKTEVFNKFK
ncbi:MAG: LytTR family DNA-binding domain-containing protein [Saprospiraceae bacterium]|nr:LytTR family DNA-binding domain-containing protein [Saprospiraceae bacterium]